jgi:hypothetical protein
MSEYTLTILCVLNMYGGCYEHEILPDSGRASLTHAHCTIDHAKRPRTAVVNPAWGFLARSNRATGLSDYRNFSDDTL